ncbi:MAG: DUF5715 family protein [Muribaculaceae bacterium]|nr:DUF5715 family protein [Muribaculaceae bacterium]
MRKFTVIIVAAVVALVVFSCGGESSGTSSLTGNVDYPEITFSLTDSVENLYMSRFDSMPPGGIKLKVNSPGVLGRVFNDSNYKQLREALNLGIKPIDSICDAWHLRRPVSKIETCRYYYVDNLTHSLPYLVPEAKQLLEDIGRTWIDSLNARGGGYYRIKVTSVLRTPATISRLRRRNRNAVDSSAHQYGTTFDISYVNFICDSVNIPRTQEDMKNLLGEVLSDFRNKGRCYVKYERKQGCFHITTRSNNGE